jgi:hypothetical protein
MDIPEPRFSSGSHRPLIPGAQAGFVRKSTAQDSTMTRASAGRSTGGLVRRAAARLRVPLAALGGVGSLATILLTTVPAHPQDAMSDQPPIHVRLGPEKDTVAGAFVTGSVKNDSRYRIGDVRLRVEILDPEGQPLESVTGWVYGDVPAGEEESFRVWVPIHGSHVRVTIESFDRVSVESP